jgi:hypothetical protein
MVDMETTYRLSKKQIITRIVSVLIAGIGGGACGFSLTLQVAEIGTVIASLTWFSGLFALVTALAGYAVSCDPGKGKSQVPLAATLVALLAIVCAVLARIFLYAQVVIYISLIAGAIETVFLIIYHFLLRREDPDAL